ncbi:hypothetical protein ACEZ3G_14110 [Maribacter algicola]|uniref:Uncharacterized protein n=1 Tax=Meishania litoralis TaxID=3434685 RepID=A0ACC7LNL2_9FLAO
MSKFKIIAVLILIWTSGLNAQEITVFPGFWSAEYYQDDERISKKEVKALMAKNEEINAYWKKSKTQGTISSVGLVAEFGFALWMYAEILNDDPYLSNRDKAKNALGPAFGVLGSGVVTGIFMYASSKSKKKAILAYNKQFDNKTTFRLVPTSNKNGVGLALRF